jgi:hypothetical protein
MDDKPIAIKNIGERDTWVGKNRLYLDEDNILNHILVGKQDDQTVLAIHNASLKMRSTVEGKVNMLVDLNQAGKPSNKARELGKDMSENEKVGKIALFGLHPVARVLAIFFLRITKKVDIRFFKTKKEALQWLKE